MDWREAETVPPDIARVLSALSFDGASGTAAGVMDWDTALEFFDRSQLTLVLGDRCRVLLPEAVAKSVAARIARNSEHRRRVDRAFAEIAAALEAAGVPFVVLKGFTQWPRYVSDPDLRVQYDIDLFCAPDGLMAARDAVASLGYEPLAGTPEDAIDHLPCMIRKTGWQWRGDYYDPELPVSVDIHFRFWDKATEGFDAPGVETFWARRSGIALAPADALAYCALHLLRHLLRGSLRPYHVYELAYFLDGHADDDGFWQTWRALHGEELRRLQAIVFRLAAEWFHCAVHSIPRRDIDALPPAVQAWFERYAASPLASHFRPNKDELWLHLALVDSLGKKLRVLRRRLLPARLPGPVDAVYVPESELTPALRIRRQARYLRYLASRAANHARSLGGVVREGAVWSTGGLGAPYWRFLGAAALFNFGLFIFFLLYNLYLLDRGYDEAFLGLVVSAMSAGSIAGTLPAGALLRRLGLRRGLVACFLGVAAVSTLRSSVAGRPALLALSFLGGAVAALWPVSIAPAVARLTTERNRPVGFSLFFASGIGLGVLGGMAGGQLPGLFARVVPNLAPAAAKQFALLTGCAVAALAAVPALRLRFPAAPAEDGKRVWPRSAFLLRFLLAIAIWNLATGAFNPLFNAYFARRLHAPVSQIGAIFSATQLLQVLALLAAPLILRRGVAGGVALTQLVAGVALAGLGVLPFAGAVLAYAVYMGFQWMSEPGIYTMLMDRVQPHEQSGAAALNFLVAFAAQAAAAAISGVAVARFGYSAVLVSAGVTAGVAAWLFKRCAARSLPTLAAGNAAG